MLSPSLKWKAKTLGLAMLLTPISALSAPVIYNLSLPNISVFDNAITSTGAAVFTAPVSAGQHVYTYIDANGNPATVTVTYTGSGSPAVPGGTYSSGAFSLSGAVWNISPFASPAGGGVGGKADIPGYNSGLTFTFSSPVNAFGFEIGDWATCCYGNVRPAAVQSDYGVPATGSGLWIAFDGGAATLPANALNATDNPGFASSGSFTNFIGAIDSSGFFSKVTFWGDGFGEYLVAGGTLRFASVPKGSIGGTVPEPATLALLGVGLVVAAVTRRRHHTAHKEGRSSHVLV
ncbi:MAG: PEP-CTERM sorting domain-containing protein [Sutterellaceae bacterium]|nr:PEP-CTERM sorting domain-containing protein [Burkholderiaceae bacterium]MDW8431063.1 PEP-CTERM sorting domain-containing protein [Sutterellaceae bacterium]